MKVGTAIGTMEIRGGYEAKVECFNCHRMKSKRSVCICGKKGRKPVEISDVETKTLQRRNSRKNARPS